MNDDHCLNQVQPCCWRVWPLIKQDYFHLHFCFCGQRNKYFQIAAPNWFAEGFWKKWIRCSKNPLFCCLEMNFSSSFEFHWFICLLSDELINLTFQDLKSGPAWIWTGTCSNLSFARLGPVLIPNLTTECFPWKDFLGCSCTPKPYLIGLPCLFINFDIFERITTNLLNLFKG